MSDAEGEPSAASGSGPGERGSERRWTLPSLSRAVDGGVVLVGQDGEVDFASPATAELTGGRSFERWWPALQQRIDERLDREALSREGEASLTLELPEELGGRTLFVRLFPVDDGDCTGYLAVLKDQRSLDALQADLRLANQMRRLSATLRQATHDLKAPLQAMTLNIDTLRGQLAAELDDQRPLERLDVLEREIRRLGRMLQMVLTQSPSDRESLRHFDLRRLLRELVTLVRPQARAAGARVEIETPREKVPVYAVRDHLKQALLNLMVNGIEAMAAGGTLSVTLHGDGELARVAIRDTGVGIAPEVRGKLFRLHFSTKPTGTGIGLFTARASIQKAGGNLALESDGRSGTTAHVTLPLDAFQAGEELPCSTS